MVSAGGSHTVLLRSDGTVVAFGDNTWRQCEIPPLDQGMYTQVLAGPWYYVRGFCALCVDWVRALTCLVPVLTCAAPRFLQGGDIQCFCEMMALLLLAGKMEFDTATFPLWLLACHTPKLE